MVNEIGKLLREGYPYSALGMALALPNICGNMLRKMAERQKTKKIIYLTIKEPWHSADPLKPIADKIIRLDCENENPTKYQRIISVYEEDCKRQEQRNRFF